MAYYQNSGQVNDEAISIAGGRTFQVVQLADISGNVTDPTATLLSSLVSGLTLPSYDNVTVNRTSGLITSIVYKSSSTTVSTVTISYDADGRITGLVQS